MHGKTTEIHHDGRACSPACRTRSTATRYHSLIVEPETCPTDLEVTAWTRRRARSWACATTAPVEGVQFHPESILTERGKELLGNFLELPA